MMIDAQQSRKNNHNPLSDKPHIDPAFAETATSQMLLSE